MWRTPGSVLILPFMSLNLTFPHPVILVIDSSPRKKLPPSYLSYSQNHSLWGVIWKDAHESTNHVSLSTCVLEESKYTSLPFTLEVFSSVEGAPSYPFTFSMLLDLHYFLKCPSFPHLRHTFTNFLGDLYLPLDLYPTWGLRYISILGESSWK